jgi:hypothetical protein
MWLFDDTIFIQKLMLLLSTQKAQVAKNGSGYDFTAC